MKPSGRIEGDERAVLVLIVEEGEIFFGPRSKSLGLVRSLEQRALVVTEQSKNGGLWAQPTAQGHREAAQP